MNTLGAVASTNGKPFTDKVGRSGLPNKFKKDNDTWQEECASTYLWDHRQSIMPYWIRCHTLSDTKHIKVGMCM